jgi:peptidoglycan/LPS O-acetylase OafA/YrhL
MPDTSQERLHALDAVRGFALLLGIFFHASVSFVQTPHDIPIWIVMDNSRSLAMSVLFFVLHIFRMTTFFLVAGFFAHMSFHKKGMRGFIRDRLKRIGIPLVVGWPILFALIVAATIWGAVVMAHGKALPPPPAYAGFPAFPLTHLWFLYVLLQLYAVTLIARSLVAAVDRSGRIRAAADRVVHAIVRNPVGFVVFATPLAITFILQPAWLQWVGIMTPDSSLVPNAMAIVGFTTAFGFGFVLHRQVGLLEIWRRRWPLNLAFALAFTAICLAILGGPLPVLKPAPHDAMTAVYSVSYAFAVWTWSFAFIGFALRFMSDHSATRRYIADSSYWLYLVHVPLVMALQVAVSQLPYPWFAKYPLVLAVTFAILFASYQLLVRYSFIGRVLNGPRESRSNRPAVPAAMEPAE